MTIWNERYAAHELAFGAHPNLYFKSVIDLCEIKYASGSIAIDKGFKKKGNSFQAGDRN